MRVKICGLTRLTDAILAYELGATELGFVLAKSPRQISISKLKEIIGQLPKSAMTIGVFVNESPENILNIVEETNLRGVQLHGEEKPEDLIYLKEKRPDLFILKAIGVKKNTFTLGPENYSHADAILFDSVGSHFTPSERGPIESDLLCNQKFSKSFYLAGGLKASNLLALIQKYKPNGIDLSSGVEIYPAIKDEQLLRDLFSILKLKDIA